MTITGKLPTGESHSFDFIVLVSTCIGTPLVPPATIQTQTYYVNFPLGDYDAPAFTTDPTCPQTMYYTNTVTANNFINNFAGAGKYLTWQTNDFLNIAQYTVTIFATNYCASNSASYTLDVRSTCDG